MKGVIFTEFYDLVEELHSPVFLQETIDMAGLPSEGVYTATGNYPPEDLVALVGAYSEKTGIPIEKMMRSFGSHIFERFSDIYPALFAGCHDAFEFLGQVETKIHAEVRKLHPDTELPTFEVLEQGEDCFRILYMSARNLGDFCEGLISGCVTHFGNRARIEKRTLAEAPRSVIEFTITRGEAC
ncbi:MAG: heme NO-binding domain-containing protein [Parvularculaceae bacterium]